MPILHNQINRLWSNPTYNSFKKSHFVKHIFTKNDAKDFLKTGAYLIQEGEKLSNLLIPWDERRRYEILKNPRLENSFMSLGTEYLMKGVFLHNDYAVNKPKAGMSGLTHPIVISRNKGKLNPADVQEMGYIINQLVNLVDFTDFDNKQKNDELKARTEMSGRRLKGITKMIVPYPTARQFLEYLLFKRNYSLHRPFIISEFRGITTQLYKFLNYIAVKGAHESIDQLARLSEI